jgi:nuclear pore complex protein Nup155
VIPTTVQVIILAVSCLPAKTQEEKINSKLNVYATDLTIPSDEINVEKVVGTDSGRVFLTSATDVYELYYQVCLLNKKKKERKRKISSFL